MIRWTFLHIHQIPRSPTIPGTTILDIPRQEQEQMRMALRRARYGYFLALPILFLCDAGRHRTEIAAFLFCSRSSVYRTVRLYRAGQLGWGVDAEGQLESPVRTTVLLPWRRGPKHFPQ